jgi:hypothetical protein
MVLTLSLTNQDSNAALLSRIGKRLTECQLGLSLQDRILKIICLMQYFGTQKSLMYSKIQDL